MKDDEETRALIKHTLIKILAIVGGVFLLSLIILVMFFAGEQ